MGNRKENHPFLRILEDPPRAIDERRSTRSYLPDPLRPKHRDQLSQSLDIINRAPGIPDLRLGFPPVLQLANGVQLERRLDPFGGNRESVNFLYMPVPPDTFAELAVGYLMEPAVLRATELGISSCWLGYFRRALLSEYCPANQILPAVVVLGYSPETRSSRDHFIRFMVKGKKRHPWGQLFFTGTFDHPLNYARDHPLAVPLEYVRKAPSAGNTQPWRLIINRSCTRIHFFKQPVNRAYESRKLHLIDLGIALSHFEIGMTQIGRQGGWVRLQSADKHLVSNLEYIISWETTG